MHSFDRDSLVTAYLPLIHSIAQQLRGQLSPAFEYDDLLQAGSVALIEIFERLPFYIRHRCRGAMVDYLRTEWRHAQHVPLDADPVGDISPAPEVQRLHHAIEALPAPEHKVLTMRLEGHTVRQIGQSMGVSHVRVHQIQKRGIERLKTAA